MKKKIIGLSLAFTFAVGMAAVGASSISYTDPVKAEGETKTIYCKVDKSWWTVDGAAVGVHYWGGTEVVGTSWPGVRMSLVEGETNVWSYDVPANTLNCIFTRYNPSDTGAADWGAKTKDLTIPTDGKNLFTITSKDAVWGDPGCDGEWSTYVPTTPSKYYVEVGGGEKQELTKNPDNTSEYCLTGITDAGNCSLKFYKDDEEISPDIKANSGLNFNNLYLEDTETLYLYDEPTDAFGIYLNVVDNNVWVTGRTSPIEGYFGAGGWENVYVYTHGGYAEGSGEYALGAWPGTKLTPISGVCFENHAGTGYGLYRFELPVNAVGKNNDKLIFNNGAEDESKAQTAELKIVEMAYYGAHYELTGDTTRYRAARFVDNFVTRLTTDENKHGDLTHAVCGISPTNAAIMYSQYINLSDEVQGYVDAATYYTYADATSTEADKNFTFAEIFAQIGLIAGFDGSGAKFYTPLNNDTTFMVSIIAVSVIAVAGLAILYIKKRKTIKE